MDQESAEEALGQHLADVPLEDLQRLKSQGHDTVAGRRARIAEQGSAAGAHRRANKNRPVEMSSKKQVPRLREVLQVPKQTIRDPRFETLCGDFDDTRFKKSYSFLYEETMPQEAEKLKKILKKEKDSDRRAQLQRRLTEINETLKEETNRRKRDEEEAAKKEEQKNRVASGHLPFFESKAKRKREDLIAKFQELKEKGNLESFLAKKRKRNATKQHTKIPAKRRGDGSMS